MDSSYVLDIVEKHRGKLGSLLMTLQDIQLVAGYLSMDSLRTVADATGRTLNDIYSFATFHDVFRFKPIDNAIPYHAASRDSEYFFVRCPHCNHSLMDPECLIESLPSVRVTVAFGLKHGWFRIPSNPVIDTFACEYEFPQNGAVHFFCPHCHSELVTVDNCSQCGAPMIPKVGERSFSVRCSNNDCISNKKEKFVSTINIEKQASCAD